jgi:hypothetical protein
MGMIPPLPVADEVITGGVEPKQKVVVTPFDGPDMDAPVR